MHFELVKLVNLSQPQSTLRRQGMMQASSMAKLIYRMPWFMPWFIVDRMVLYYFILVMWEDLLVKAIFHRSRLLWQSHFYQQVPSRAFPAKAGQSKRWYHAGIPLSGQTHGATFQRQRMVGACSYESRLDLREIAGNVNITPHHSNGAGIPPTWKMLITCQSYFKDNRMTMVIRMVALQMTNDN